MGSYKLLYSFSVSGFGVQQSLLSSSDLSFIDISLVKSGHLISLPEMENFF